MKRFLFAGLLATALFGVATRSQAHWFPTSAGWVYHSISCEITMKKGGDQKVGSVSCTITPTALATVYCAVPGNNFTFAGTAAVQPVTVILPPAPDSGPQGAGGNLYTASVLAFNPKLEDFIGSCPNRNWSVVAVVLEQFTSVIEVKDSNGVVATRVEGTCTIPPRFQDTVPLPGTQFICDTNLEAAHLN